MSNKPAFIPQDCRLQVEIEVERHSRKRKPRSQELQIRLTVFVGVSKALIVFAYVPEIDVITARFSDKDVQHQYVLAAMFPNDTGESWPGDQRPDASTTVHNNARPYKCAAESEISLAATDLIALAADLHP